MLGVGARTSNDGGRMPAQRNTTLLRSSAVVSFGTLLSRLTGLARVAALAGVLGSTTLADTYNTANGMPNIVYELLLGGVLSGALIPLFVRRLEDRDHEGISAIVTCGIVVLAGLTLLSVAAAPLISAALSITKPDEVRGPLTVLLRWFLPQVFFYGIIALASALLNARRRYALAALAPAMNNLVALTMLLALPRLVEASLNGKGALQAARADPTVFLLLGLGTTGGVALSALVLLPALAGVRPRLQWRHAAVTELMSLSRWTAGHALVNQIDNFFVVAVAYNLAEGAASAYAYAWIVWVTPHGLIAAALLTTLTPEFTKLAQRTSLVPLRRAWTNGLRVTMLAMLPASAGLTVAAYPLMRVVPFFSRTTADQIAGVLTLIGPGLVSYSVFLYTLRVFYALGDTRTPFYVNLLQNVVHVVLAIPLGAWLGAPGLGLLSTIAYSTGAFAGFVAAARRLGRVPISEVRPIVAMIAAAVSMALVVAAALALLQWNGREPSPVLALLVCLLVGPSTYLGYLWTFGAHGEMQTLLARLRRG